MMHSHSPLAHSQLAHRSITNIWATPHDSYSSSIGVPGCKINTDRVAYFPTPVDCDSICVSLHHAGRQVYLLRIDQSQGAHDVSYDAFNYLLTGRSAADSPVASGPVAMQVEAVEASRCAGLIRTAGHRLPLSAANSMNFLAGCLEEHPQSWVAGNHVLYNILDSLCTLGHDEVCSLDWPHANQAQCPNTLGVPVPLAGDPVYNIQYPSGNRVLAGAAVPSPPAPPGPGGRKNGADVRHRSPLVRTLLWSLLMAIVA